MIIKFPFRSTRRYFFSDGALLVLLALGCLSQIGYSLLAGHQMVDRINKIALVTPALPKVSHPAVAIPSLTNSLAENRS